MKLLWSGMVLAVLLVGGCSSEEQVEEESSAVERATEAAGREMAERIQRPIDKARAVQAQEDERNETIRKQAQ